MIAAESEFLTTPSTFKQDIKNPETLVCLEDTEYLYIDQTDLDQLLAHSPLFEAIYRSIFEEYMIRYINHLQLLANADVPAKIHYLKTHFPHLLFRCTDSVFASFLGISRQTFVAHKYLLY
jgi:CRP-like cAMP-binding protein